MQTDAPAEGLIIHPREIGSMLYRRRWWLIAAILAGTLLAVVAIAMQRPMYRSSATLLIDSQQISTTLVASPLTSIANERISKIRQQVMSRDSLTAILDQHKLYPRERSQMAIEDVLNLMRGAIAVDLVGASENQGGQGRTIAFTISFTYQEAAKAQAVTQTLTQLFLSEDKRFRTEQATGAAAFLARRAEELRRQLSTLEEDRRAIEARYAGALPNQVGMSAQSEATLRAEISRIDAESQGLSQQNSLLAAREREAEQAPRPEDEAASRAEERLNQLTSTYSDNYPEVIAARAALARQRAALRNTPQGSGGVIQTEIAAGRSRIEMLAARRAQLIETVGDMNRRTALAPQASYELAMVEREYDNMRRQYEELREKQLDAQVAANLQAEDKGERFSIVDDPSFPHVPIGTKPLMLLLMGVLGGAGTGVCVVVAYELLRGTIHGEHALKRATGQAPLTVVTIDRGLHSGRGLRGFIGRIIGSAPEENRHAA